MCSVNLSDVEEAYNEACNDQALGRPNPFIQPSVPSPTAGTILDFLRQQRHSYILIKQTIRPYLGDNNELSL